MGSLYRLGQKFVDFCNVVQQNQNSEVTVPSSAVLYAESAGIKESLPKTATITVTTGSNGIANTLLASDTIRITSIGCTSQNAVVVPFIVPGSTNTWFIQAYTFGTPSPLANTELVLTYDYIER